MKLPERWPEALFALCVAGCVWAMATVPMWETVPFHFAWLALSVVYGFRMRGTAETLALVGAVALATTVPLLVASRGDAEALHELAEVPLMTTLFVAVVWHARRRQSALHELRAAADRERDFVLDASHLLRTPITVARGHAELIGTAHPSSQTGEDAATILEELDRLARIADRLLVLTAAERHDLLMVRPVDLKRLLLGTAARWRAAADRRWEVSLLAEGTVLADEERLHQALDALIENAVKATDPGARIGMGTRRDGPDVLIEVSDAGVGIAPEHLDRIFDRFARIGPDEGGRGAGTGLGLPMVRAIAEAHAGSVTVSSEPGHRTTFRLRLAHASPAQPQLRGPERIRQSADGHVDRVAAQEGR